jgi:serine/threonine protein kinase/tetratricopeptide (TPR) repeat protein
MQMTPDNWNAAKELFEAALELDSSQRSAFLAENCREESVRQQVERLLNDYQEAGSFLDAPASNALEQIPREDASLLHSLPVTATSAEAENPMVGRQLGAYKLMRRVGQGGMAAVFLAARADDEYHKQVAVKLVQPGLDSRDLLDRFRTERQTLAGLDHPNIVKLLDGGSTPDGLPFLVMDYVDGKPIDEYCDQHRLSVDERLHLFGKVCDAVQYAHQNLVIHRDLKPSNILVVGDGTPKLLDFGIAKVLSPEHSAQGLQLTQTGTRCMTPAYASPEQMRAKQVTPSTDIYSLGVVLYELLTGHRPYRLTQHTPAEIERAICEQEPENPSTAVSRVENDTSSDGRPTTRTPELVSLVREGQPDKLRRRLRGDLDNIVLKALQKEPQRRYESVGDLSEDIGRHLQHLPVRARPSTFAYRASKFAQRHKAEVSAAFVILVVVAAAAAFAFNPLGSRARLAIGSPHLRIQSLAVLPLANLSGDPAQEYFSDGMTDALITDLAQIGSLKVISRTSTLQYKQTKKTLPEIARELNVDGIVEGTVQRAGDHVRITAQLIHGPSDRHVWANSYERDVSDVLTIERDVTQEIARQIQAQVTTQYAASLQQSRPVNPKALDAYLQGNYHLNRQGRGGGDEEKKKAAEYFQQAIDADPNFALAYNGLANAHFNLLWPSSEDAKIVRTAAEKAVELDPTLSDARVTLGHLRLCSSDFRAAEDELRRAVALSPNNASGHEILGDFLNDIGRLDEGLRESQIAQELDPNQDHLMFALDSRREYDRSIAWILMMLKGDPDNGYFHHNLFRSYVEKGRYKEAIEELEKTLSLFGLQESAARVDHAFANSGYRGAMQQYAEELEQLAAMKQVFIPINLAEVYAALGDKDRAFYWLEQAYTHHDIVAVANGLGLEMINVDPLMDPLRSDPRFKDLVRRIGLLP